MALSKKLASELTESVASAMRVLVENSGISHVQAKIKSPRTHDVGTFDDEVWYRKALIDFMRFLLRVPLAVVCGI